MTGSALRGAARSVQQRLEAFYGLEAGPDVGEFVHGASGGGRELLVLRHDDDGVAIAVVLPESAAARPGTLDDAYLQLVEGVSHFVYLAERARIELPATELELELQAEVDKFVLFAFDGATLVTERALPLGRTLYQRVRYLHPPESEPGRRYRLANRLAATLARRLAERPRRPARALLQRLYRAGQSEKIRLAGAA